MTESKVCPHIRDCKQLIDKENLPCCLGDIEDWCFDDCFKYNDLQQEATFKKTKHPRTPRNWQGVTDIYAFKRDGRKVLGVKESRKQ